MLWEAIRIAGPGCQTQLKSEPNGGSDEIVGVKLTLTGIPAANFARGKYTAVALTEDITLYRGGSSMGSPLGQWFTTSPPVSVAQVRIDTAVKPQWIDPLTGHLIAKLPIDSVYAVKVPAGTKIYVGPLGSQGGVYVGGQSIEQIFISEPWKINSLEIISKNPLK